MPLRILITGTSAAVSQVTKTIIDRSLHNCKSEIVDYKQLSLSAEKADYDFAVINDLMADIYYRLPSALNDVPSVLITNNDRILTDPKRFGFLVQSKTQAAVRRVLLLLKRADSYHQ